MVTLLLTLSPALSHRLLERKSLLAQGTAVKKGTRLAFKALPAIRAGTELPVRKEAKERK